MSLQVGQRELTERCQRALPAGRRLTERDSLPGAFNSLGLPRKLMRTYSFRLVVNNMEERRHPTFAAGRGKLQKPLQAVRLLRRCSGMPGGCAGAACQDQPGGTFAPAAPASPRRTPS